MKVLDISHGHDSYEVVLQASPLWECALGIAVSTYPAIHDSLVELPPRPTELHDLLTYVQEHNTWYALLQVLHATGETELAGFVRRVERMYAEELKRTVLPFLGTHLEEARSRAACGDAEALAEMLSGCQGHLFFPGYVEYIVQVEAEKLRLHLIDAMRGWHESVIAPQLKELEAILQRDLAAKHSMRERLQPEAFVEWATGGIEYKPEPGVSRVLLIPQVCYRPWNVRGTLLGAQVFYYPVADESLSADHDPYLAPTGLVQTHKALGDENRLRIVKYLFEADRTLQELTELLDLAKSTIHHHLSLLRAAKVVKTEGVTYSLIRRTLQLADKQLMEYLERADIR
jgi:DNA-binding transcriptional ArsR family regulator